MSDLESNATGTLVAWCLHLGLEATGARADLVARLRDALRAEFPEAQVEVLPDEEVVALGEGELRGLLARYGFECEGTRSQLVSWLLWFFDDVRRDAGLPERHSAEALKAMPVERLRELCAMWNMRRTGRPHHLRYRILCAQGGAWPPSGTTGHRVEPPPGVIPIADIAGFSLRPPAGDGGGD